MATHPPVHVFDEYYLVLSLLFVLTWLAIGFFLSSKYDYDEGHDIILGSCFVTLAIFLPSMGGSTASPQISSAIVTMLWGIRMAAFIRYYIKDVERPPQERGMKTWLKIPSIFRTGIIYVLEALWTWLSCLPIAILNSPAVLKYPQPSLTTWPLFIGCEVVMFALAFNFHTPADYVHYPNVIGAGDPQVGPYSLCRWGPNPAADFFFEAGLATFVTALYMDEDHSDNIIGNSGSLYNLVCMMIFYCCFLGLWIFVELFWPYECCVRRTNELNIRACSADRSS